jgi:hypothetical protein
VDIHLSFFILIIIHENKIYRKKEHSKKENRNDGFYSLIPCFFSAFNSNLLYSRAHDRSMAFNDSVLEIVQNGTSMEQISKFVNDIANKLGTSSESLSGYTAKQAQKIAGGI